MARSRLAIECPNKELRLVNVSSKRRREEMQIYSKLDLIIAAVYVIFVQHGCVNVILKIRNNFAHKKKTRNLTDFTV